MSDENVGGSAQTPNGGQPSDAAEEAGQAGVTGPAKTALAEEALLNAAVAFAGRVVTTAQQGAAEAAAQASPAVREVMIRQYFLETATLCLRRLGESYETAAGDPNLAALADLLRDGARQAQEVTGAVETLGDLGLDLLDQLLEE